MIFLTTGYGEKGYCFGQMKTACCMILQRLQREWIFIPWLELPEWSYEGEIEGAGFNDKYNLAFAARGPLGVSSVIRFKYKQKPEKCILLRKGKTKDVKMTFHEESGTFLIKFNNDPDGLFFIFK